MTLNEIFDNIEGHRFAAEVNTVSGSGTFYRALSGHPLVRQVVDRLSDAGVRGSIASRLLEVTQRESDLCYENPFDAAIAAYLTVLKNFEGPEELQQAVEAVLRVPNCWWARDLALRFRTEVSNQRMRSGLVSSGRTSLTTHAPGVEALSALENVAGSLNPDQLGFRRPTSNVVASATGSPAATVSSANRTTKFIYRHRGTRRGKRIVAGKRIAA
jgi:hypothetical protein